MTETTTGDCDAEEWGAHPTMLDGKCRCLVCARCGHHTGNANQGHYWSWCSVTKDIREAHFCCSDPAFGCELEQALTVGSAPMTVDQVRARLEELAPYPRPPEKATSQGLARCIAVGALMGWHRNTSPFVRPDQEVPLGLIRTEYVAACALAALADLGHDGTAREIAEALSKPEELGEQLAELLVGLGVEDPDEAAVLDAALLRAARSTQ